MVYFTHTFKREIKIMKRILLFAALLGAGCSIDAGKTEGKEASAKPFRVASFLPENNYHERSYYQAGEVTEQDFDAVLYAAEEIYGPIVESFGARLIVNGDFRSPTVNAYADQDGDEWSISFFGGLAKHKDMTLNGFVIVVCHELGHHLGGFPMYRDSPWQASNEGNSDYFATASCARKMFDPSSPLRYWGVDLWKKRKPDPTQSQNCTGSNIDKEVCQMSLDGGLSLGKVLADLGGDNVPSYSTPDKTVVKKTLDSHPNAQCRLDSYKAGAFCSKEWRDDMIARNKSEMAQVSCSDRPRCWYAP